MRTGIIAAIAVGVVALGIAGSVAGTYNSAVSLENQIVAVSDNNEQILGQFYQKLDETVQVADIYKEDFKETMTAMLAGRYGPDGSQAAFQWIKESMPNLDPEIYRNLQTLIESNRSQFQNEQTKLIDVRRQYDNKLDRFPSNIVLGAFGFPRLDLEDPKYNAVDVGAATEAFETGIEAPRVLRPAAVEVTPEVPSDF